LLPAHPAGSFVSAGANSSDLRTMVNNAEMPVSQALSSFPATSALIIA
jgi:hypothetical protein